MRQCLRSRDSLFWVEVRHGTYKTFEILINPTPETKWLARIFFVEAIPKDLENTNPGIIGPKMFQEPIQSIFIREVRDLALDDDGQWINAFFQVLVSHGKYDAFVQRKNALQDSE